jgi:hypothetical protein
MSANKVKVSVSLSPDMIEWLKAESARETQESGEDVSVSRLVVRAVRAMQGKACPQPHTGGNKPATAKTVKGSESSVGGRSTATSNRFRKTG